MGEGHADILEVVVGNNTLDIQGEGEDNVPWKVEDAELLDFQMLPEEDSAPKAEGVMTTVVVLEHQEVPVVNQDEFPLVEVGSNNCGEAEAQKLEAVHAY
jgi:hypothetical protein